MTVTLTASPTGGQGSSGENDLFAGGSLDVIGTGQADTITVTTATGDHTFTGRAGADTLDGGALGSVTSSYADRAAPVTADLDGVNDDGVAGENDVLTNIDNLTGGSAADTLNGDGGVNILKGGDGADQLSGLAGGDDLTGGDGADALSGGDGADAIKSRDTFADTVSCGTAIDSVVSDVLDAIAGDCENVDDGVANAPPTDATAPLITAAGASPKTFAVDKQGPAEVGVAKRKRRAKKGTTFTYTLSEAARVVFTIEQQSTGRKVKGKCVKQTRKNRKQRKCTLLKRTGRFAQQGVRGKDTKKFSGKIGARKLKPGSYRATLVATDASGNSSKAAQVSFKVVRG